MNEQNNEQLMLRYLQGSCTPEERTRFEAWLLASEENRKQFYETRVLWYASRIEFFGSKEQLDKARATLNHNIQQRQPPFSKKIYVQWAKYAAIFIGAIAVAWLFWILNHHAGKTNTLLIAAVAHTDSSKLVVLSDGTHVWLNSNSQITYPSQFASDKRMVTLKGEAFFDVTHDPAHPFIIHTPSIDIKVLGTSFNVQAYSPENGVEATLVRGKIAIGDSLGHELAVMAPGQMARFAANKLTVQSVDPELYTNWRYGNIAMNGADLKTIARKLAELYQVHVTIPPAIADTARYNFTFSKRKPVKDVMNMLCFIAPIHYRLQGNDILITQK